MPACRKEHSASSRLNACNFFIKIITSCYWKAGGMDWETLCMRKQNPMQKLMIWILVITEGTWQTYPLHSLLSVFKSESLAIVIRGKTEIRGFVNNLHRKLNFIICRCYMHCCWQHVLMLLGMASFDFHLPSEGQSRIPTITILTFFDIHLHTIHHFSLLHGFFLQSWLLFCFVLFWEREREKMHFSAYLYASLTITC